MKSTSFSYKTTVLELTEKETSWLSELIQNDLSGQETPEQKSIRASFWEALHPTTAKELV